LGLGFVFKVKRFMVPGLGLRVQGSGLRAQSLGLQSRVLSLGSRIGLKVCGFRVKLGFKVY